MGLWSWFFPSPEDRLARARAHLAAGRFAEARDELDGVGLPEADSLRTEAANALARVNLEHAVSWCEAGDDQRVGLHMELAENLHAGGLDAEFRAIRGRLRELRAERQAAAERARAEKEARLLSVDPLGVSGGASLLQAPLDLSHADPDAEERAQRLALLIEGYPKVLQTFVAPLGPSFARAVLDLDDGRPDLALPALAQMDASNPLVRWERARCSYAMGDLAAALTELRGFALHANGHHAVGNQHSGVWLAELLAENRDFHSALALLRELRVTSPNLGGALYAQLLEATDALPEAEEVLRKLIAQAPRADLHYLLLARVRLRGGHREAAKSALEQAMQQVCDSRGCAHKPPNPDVVRSLAMLYLEDDSDRARGLDLAEQSAKLVGDQMGWEDAYLATLAATRAGDPEAEDLVDRLWELTPENHPGRARLVQYIPEAA